MLHWFLIFCKFTKFIQSSALFRKTSTNFFLFSVLFLPAGHVFNLCWFHNTDDLCNRHINFTSGHQHCDTSDRLVPYMTNDRPYCHGTATKEHCQCCLNNEERTERLTKGRIIGGESEYEFIKRQDKGSNCPEDVKSYYFSAISYFLK